MPDFMTQPYGGFSPGLGPMGSRPVRNVQTRNVNSQVGIDVPLPPPNPMREVQQPTQPVQPQMGVPGDQGYANPALADALLAMSQQGADSPIEAIGNIAAAWASQKQSERVAQYEAQKAERERQREMQMYEKRRQDSLSDYRAQKGIDQEFNPKQPKAPETITGYDDQGRKRVMQWDGAGWQPVGGTEAPDPMAGMEAEQSLRKEYAGTEQHKRFDEVRASFERVQASASANSGPGDLGLIFGFMKMLDPGSVVREGEFANAENAQGIPDRVRNLYNRVISGERLAPNQRQEFVGLARDLYEKEAAKMSDLNERYTGIAGTYGVEPSRVVAPLPNYDAPPPPSGNRPRAKNPQTGDIIEFDGQQWVPVQ